MSAFTDAEIELLNNQRLGRLATVGADDMPHVVPVAVFYDPDAEALVIGANAEFGEAGVTELAKIGAHLAPGMAPEAFPMRSNYFSELQPLYGIES